MGQAISDEVDTHNGQYSFKTTIWLQWNYAKYIVHTLIERLAKKMYI